MPETMRTAGGRIFRQANDLNRAAAAWWHTLQPGEQLLAATGAGCALVFAVLYWTPLGNRRVAVKCLVLSVLVHLLAWQLVGRLDLTPPARTAVDPDAGVFDLADTETPDEVAAADRPLADLLDPRDRQAPSVADADLTEPEPTAPDRDETLPDPETPVDREVDAIEVPDLPEPAAPGPRAQQPEAPLAAAEAPEIAVPSEEPETPAEVAVAEVPEPVRAPVERLDRPQSEIAVTPADLASSADTAADLPSEVVARTPERQWLDEDLAAVPAPPAGVTEEPATADDADLLSGPVAVDRMRPPGGVRRRSDGSPPPAGMAAPPRPDGIGSAAALAPPEVAASGIPRRLGEELASAAPLIPAPLPTARPSPDPDRRMVPTGPGRPSAPEATTGNAGEPGIESAKSLTGRAEGLRPALVQRYGGDARTERAVAAALDWLARHQNERGFWDSDRFFDECPDGDRCTGPAVERGSDTGLTGLSLLAFLGAGHTHLSSPRYRTVVTKGLGYLITNQDADGSIRGDGWMYSHAMATMALTEAYAMSGDQRLRPFAQRGIDYIVAVQNAGDGGWRYLPGQAGDTSVFGWVVLALRDAREAGLNVPEKTWIDAQRWLPSVAAGVYGGKVRYRPGNVISHAMSAEALACRQIFGQAGDTPTALEGVEYVLEKTPAPADYDLYYWYYGTLALFQHGGRPWQRWNEALVPTLVGTQVTRGHAAGSWDPQRPFGIDGGRVFTTACSALCLEVYYRYRRDVADSP